MNAWFRLLLLGLLVLGPATAGARLAAQAPDSGIAALLEELERVALSGQPAAYLDLLSADADREAARSFATQNFSARLDRATIRERGRQPLGPAGPAGQRYRLVVSALFERGNQGRLLSWELDVESASGPSEPGRSPNAIPWRVTAERRLGGAFENLYRLALDPSTQFSASDLALTSEDLELRLSRGSVFVASAGGQPTALLLVGKGEAVFSPSPPAERGQLKVFAGADVLRTPFDACLVRVAPGSLDVTARRALKAQAPVPGDVQRARQLFSEDIVRSYTLDVGDIDRGPWSLLPASGDFLAEIHTRRLGDLTYARTRSEPEDVTLFDRLHHRTISLYGSREKLAARGRFFDDSAQADYQVDHYDVTATFSPGQQWLDARARLLLHVRAEALTTLKVRLASSLTVRSAVVEGLGRLAAVRVGGQDTVLLTLPATATRDTRIALSIAYGGRLPPLTTLATTSASDQAAPRGGLREAVEPSYLYTTPVAWYPQPSAASYATATLQLTVPAPYSCVASGQLISKSTVVGSGPAGAPATSFSFNADRPVPYLSCLITRLVPVAEDKGTAPVLDVQANPEQEKAARVLGRSAADIQHFYASLMGGTPYPALSLAVIDGVLPAGHSPAYLALVSQQVLSSSLAWRDDPSAFPDFPEFFIAHEIAHQWWGQAIGAKNYHEQWLSEAFAQYFAALYAEHAHGAATFAAIMKRMRGWAMRSVGEGPVYLGARAGQLRNDGRVFRAVVYDRGAVVLHMLRRLIGDRAFFDGVRRFYRTFQFKKAGSDDLRQALEAEAGMSLRRFFDRWVYADTLPRVNYSWRTAQEAGNPELVLRFEQPADIFDFPVTVSVEYADRPAVDMVVKVTDRVVEQRVVPAGRVRNVSVNRDDLVPADFSRK